MTQGIESDISLAESANQHVAYTDAVDVLKNGWVQQLNLAADDIANIMNKNSSSYAIQGDSGVSYFIPKASGSQNPRLDIKRNSIDIPAYGSHIDNKELKRNIKIALSMASVAPGYKAIAHIKKSSADGHITVDFYAFGPPSAAEKSLELLRKTRATGSDTAQRLLQEIAEEPMTDGDKNDGLDDED